MDFFLSYLCKWIVQFTSTQCEWLCVPLFLGFAGVGLTSGSTRSVPDIAAPLLSSFPPLHLSATALLICRKKWNFYIGESTFWFFSPDFNRRVEEHSAQRIHCAIKYLNDGFRWTLTCALYAQTNLNEHHFVRFRFFPGSKIKTKPSGRKSKKQGFIKRSIWQYSWTAGELSSSLPRHTERSSAEPTQEAGPACSPVHGAAWRPQMSCNQPITRKQESVPPFRHKKLSLWYTGSPPLNRWPEVDWWQVGLPTAPAAANEQLLNAPCRKKQVGPQQHTTQNPGSCCLCQVEDGI